MVKAEERVLLHRRNVLGRKVRGRGQHLGNAPSAGRALGVHNKQAGDHHQRVEDDGEVAQPLSKLLDTLDGEDKLPKTILYCLNPKDNEVLGTMLGNFQGGGIAGKIQFGSGWWFNDQKDGMERQMMALSQLGLLSQFVGMLTDSRSFLSYTRHEYFRRILCNYIGGLVENGEYPADMDILGEIIENICYNNAVRYCKGQ